MQYRTFGKLDWEPSALGFGAMRLPILDGDSSKIDEPLATRMIRTAIDAGVNYVDTAWPYHQQQSEPFVGRVLQDGYRDKVKLATKLPSWLIKEAADFDKHLNIQLERLQTDTIDFYLLHGLNKTAWPNLRDLGVLAWAEKAIASGRIQYLGFSFHDDLSVFKEIVDANDWTFCQIMYNYMDTHFQAGEEGLAYAANKGLAVVVMEPLRGGSLTRPAPQPVADLWAGASTQRSQADWALQWVWNNPKVSLLLSGMTEMQHVEENLVSASKSGVGLLSPDELDLVDRVSKAYRSLSPIPCTDCKYCMPCPSGVAIPRIFSLYNAVQMYGDDANAKRSYNLFMSPENRADQCVECGQCEEACPQQIKIIEWLKTCHSFLAESASS
ncbi:aldo/keto reductase [Candidatus Bipolaricaulota bacterium]|nr:aldo/keto reductase [Candidatus Bipolaricaulota bacterium]TFH09579.1 MAG: aldo/keto reductase [Candidatus Atribacteria bacterium]